MKREPGWLTLSRETSGMVNRSGETAMKKSCWGCLMAMLLTACSGNRVVNYDVGEAR